MPPHAARDAAGDTVDLKRRLQPFVWLLTPGERRSRGLSRLRAAKVRRDVQKVIDAARRGGRPAVVVAMLEHMGDVIAVEPAVRAVRRRHPTAHLTFAVKPAWASLVEAHPDVDHVCQVSCLGDWMYLAADKIFQRVYDLQLPGRWCAATGLLLGDRGRRTGPTIADYYDHGGLLDVALQVGGIDPADLPERQPRLHLPDAARAAADAMGLPDGLVVLHTRSNQASRDWNAPGWRAVASSLWDDHGLTTAVVGVHAADDAVPDAAHDLRGLDVAVTAEVIRRARLFVGIDSGPAHLANGVGTPGVILMGRYGRYTGHMPFSGGFADGSRAVIVRHDGPLAEMPASSGVSAVGEAVARFVHVH